MLHAIIEQSENPKMNFGFLFQSDDYLFDRGLSQQYQNPTKKKILI